MTSIASIPLACGTPLLIERIDGVRSVGLSWLIPAGYGFDPEARVGIAVLASELLLRGCGARDSRAFADDMDLLGVVRNADATPRWMRLSLACLGDRLLDALPILVDMVRRPRFDESAVEPARALALQALAGLKDNPQERASILLAQRHNLVPLNRSPLGEEPGLRAATRDEIAAHWSRRALPGGSIIAAAGAVDPDALAARLDSLLAGWSGAASDLALEPSLTRGAYHHEPDESNQVQILLAHESIPEPHPDSVLERLAIAVLSGGSASRLFSEVREKRGLCYSVSATYAADRDFGRVVAYVGTTPERAQQSLDVLTAELRRINTPEGAVTDEELQRAKIGVRAGLVFSGESTQARAAALASDQHRLGRPRSLHEVASAVEAVTLDRLNAYLARRAIGPITHVTLGPAELKIP